MVDTLELDGRVVSADTDKASALALVFFPSLPPVSDWRQTEIDHTWSTHRPPGVLDFVEVSIAEVVSAIRQMRPKAAPGLDNIPVSTLKENIYIIAPWLALIYMASLSLHYFLELWKTTKLIPLKKPGKSSYSTPQLSTHQLALPPWEGPREDCELEIDASAGVSLLVNSILVQISRRLAGGVCLPSDHRGYLFGIQMWAAAPSGGA